MKWLPETWSRTKPCRTRKRAISRGLTAGSLGILKVERGNQSFVVGRGWFVLFVQAVDISDDRFLGHFFCFIQRTSVRHAARQRGNKSGKSAFWLRTEHNIEMAVTFFHGMSAF